MATQPPPTYPPFLNTFEEFLGHLDEEFAGLTNVERGRRFSELVLRLLPELEEAREFPDPRRSEKETHDEGVDLFTAEKDNGDQLFVQSKFRIKTKDEFDTIISKFEAYEKQLNAPPAQASLDFDGAAVSAAAPVFMVVTASKMDVVLANYKNSRLSSRAFYDRLSAETRVILITGPRILTELQRLYSRSYVLPSNVKLESSPG